MTDSQALDLTPQQQTRLTLIEADLTRARLTDLGCEPTAGLILLVEQLRSSLTDAVTLVRELSR